MASPGDYSSPTAARAARAAGERRRGGRGFYRDRGLAAPGHDESGTVKRDRGRTPDERAAAALARELAGLAEEFPRFRGALNRLRHHVLVQLRGDEWQQQAILGVLGVEPVSVEELVEETDLDCQNVETQLAVLAAKGAAAKCNRLGAPVVIRRDGKPAEKVYWIRPARSPKSKVRSPKSGVQSDVHS